MDEQPKAITDIIKQKIDAFKDYDPNKKLVVLTVFALVISILVVLTFWVNKANFRILYSNLGVKEAGKITGILKEKKISYRLEDGGTTILVPGNSIYQIRLDLASNGHPKSGMIGFELFDQSDFQSSDFAENIKYIRALQGELSNTIGHLDAIEDCRVNLSIPQRRIYLDEEIAPSASVVLKLANSKILGDEEVKGIAQLIAGCVEGLKVENVAIMSTDGKLLSEFLQEGNMGLANYQLKIKKELQKNIEMKIVSMLNSVLGPGKSVVKVNVEIQNEQKTIKKELYKPMENNAGVVRSSKVLVENYENKTPASGANNAPPAATGGGPATNPVSQSNLDNPEKGVYKQKSTTTNYEISRVFENQIVTPGQIQKMSIGILIDSTAKLTPRKLADLKDVISSISGIDKNRGDMLTLKSIKFKRQDSIIDFAGDGDFLSPIKKHLPLIMTALAPLFVLMILLSLFRKKPKALPRPKAAVPKKANVLSREEAIPFSMDPLKPDLFPDMVKESMKGESTPIQNSEVGRLQETLKGFVKENPTLVASVLEKWTTGG